MSTGVKMAASEKWKILRRAILAAKMSDELKSDVEPPASSTRAFSSFGLFEVSPNKSLESGELWLDYTYAVDDKVLCRTSVKTLQNPVLLKDMVGFNNTGNICIWPAEEVLAYHCLTNVDVFSKTNVCELGCGMTGLAGIMLACTKGPAHVLLTDGNELSVKNVREIVDVNKWQFDGTEVNCDVIRWGKEYVLKDDYVGMFDYVLCSDCLFFDEVHQELSLLIKKLLKPDKGIAILFAPKRGCTLEQFCEVAKSCFEVECIERYNEQVWKTCNEMPETFNVDRHYPIKIVLKQLLQ